MNNAEAYMVKVTRVCEVPSSNVATPASALAYWRDVIARQLWFDEDKEHLIALMLNTDCNVQGFSLISIGALHETVAYPREIFRAAVASAAYAIVLMHNHPSGSLVPSEADKHVTERCLACGKLLDVRLFDHIIIGGGSSFSFKENGLL